ncbi:hypothetical protein [Streptosporangium roseum]|uniref:hypothetical protein n=1 Tax=Streptosporangium roseum TaxID=2001 RepID=UPI0004CD9A09|nr:hypothetical protein [Streptosporangium roseum]
MSTPTTAPAPADSLDLTKPYLGWLNHYSAGWQAAIVYLRDGRRRAYRLGDELPFDRATQLCQVLATVTGVQVAGELSKQGFLPLAKDAA